MIYEQALPPEGQALETYHPTFVVDTCYTFLDGANDAGYTTPVGVNGEYVDFDYTAVNALLHERGMTTEEITQLTVHVSSEAAKTEAGLAIYDADTKTVELRPWSYTYPLEHTDPDAIDDELTCREQKLSEAFAAAVVEAAVDAGHKTPEMLKREAEMERDKLEFLGFVAAIDVAALIAIIPSDLVLKQIGLLPAIIALLGGSVGFALAGTGGAKDRMRFDIDKMTKQLADVAASEAPKDLVWLSE